MEALEFKKWQGQWWEFLDAERLESRVSKSRGWEQRVEASGGTEEPDRREKKEVVEEFWEWKSENLDNSWPVPGTRSQSASLHHARNMQEGGKNWWNGYIDQRYTARMLGGNNTLLLLRVNPTRDLHEIRKKRWNKKRGWGGKLQKCSIVVVQVQSGEQAGTRIQRKLRCLWTMASRYLVRVERRWKSDDGSVCQQLLFPSRACMYSLSTDQWRESYRSYFFHWNQKAAICSDFNLKYLLRKCIINIKHVIRFFFLNKCIENISELDEQVAPPPQKDDFLKC